MLGQPWQALMKEIDGLIACSHYGVIEWLCTYDPTVSADVAGKRSARSWGDTEPPLHPEGCGVGGAEPTALGPPSIPAVLAVWVFLEVSRFIQCHWVTPPHLQPAQLPTRSL